MSAFEELLRLNVNDKIEKKTNGNKELSYLSWSYAWAEAKKRFPDMSYTIWKDENHLPYVYDPNTGYMVFTSVTIDGITHEMWLPVMDSHNAAMKKEPYKVKTKYSEYDVAAADMFDINKTIMRCLVKNLAMFGLGLYIYAGEDLPEGEEEPQRPVQQADPVEEAKARAELMKLIREHNINVEAICKKYGVDRINAMNTEQARHCIAWIESKTKKKEESADAIRAVFSK